MKPAREPASSRSKLCASLKSPTNLVRLPLLVVLVRRKTPWPDITFSLRNLRVYAFHSCAQGFSTALARQRSSCPPPSPNLVRTHPIERYQDLLESAPCLSRAATPPKGHQIGARKRRAPGNTILSQPYRHRVPTDRLNRKGSQLAASHEGGPGSTPAGKTLPHSYPKILELIPVSRIVVHLAYLQFENIWMYVYTATVNTCKC